MIKPVLRIDGHTTTNARERFSRLCVQVCLDKPLVKTIFIRKFRQPIAYEGIHSLCFSCAQLSHKKENCPQTIKVNLRPATQEQGNSASKTTNAGPSSPLNLSEPPVLAHEDPPIVSGLDQYSPWLLVSRKKPNPKKKLATPGTYF